MPRSSFNHGLVHTVVLTNYIAFGMDSPMTKWFINDMTVNLNRQKTPWVIVIWHTPIYNSVAGHYKVHRTLHSKCQEPCAYWA